MLIKPPFRLLHSQLGEKSVDYLHIMLYVLYLFIELFLSFSKHVSNVQRCDYLPLQKVVRAAAHNDEAKCSGMSAVVTHAGLQ